MPDRKQGWVGLGLLAGLLLSACSTAVKTDSNLTCQPECNPLLVNRIRVGVNPIGVAVSTDGSSVYVANSTNDSVSKISIQSMQVVSTLPIAGTPAWIAVSKTQPLVCVTARDGRTLNVINQPGNYVQSSIELPYAPEKVVIHPEKNLAFVGCGSDPYLCVVDLDKGKSVQSVATQDPCLGMALSIDGKLLFVGTRGLRFNLMVFSTDGMLLVNRDSAGSAPVAIAVNPNNEYAYIINHDSNDITVFHIPTRHTVLTIPVDQGPVDAVVSPKGNYLYVSCQLENNVVIVDLASNQVVFRIPLEVSPWGIAMAPDASRLFLANYENKISGRNQPGNYSAAAQLSRNAGAGVNNNTLLVFDTQKYR